MTGSGWYRRGAAAAFAMAALAAVAVVPSAVAGSGTRARPALGELQRAPNATAKDQGSQEENEVLARAAQENAIRTAPAATVPARAYLAAVAHASRLPIVGGRWQELTDKPFLNDPVPGYRDPIWSDFGSGYGLVTGRMSALTATRGAVFAGAADGGVWKSTDGGRRWITWSDGLPRLSIGALATDPRDGSVWVGLGEANTAFDNFNGFGVYRLAAGAGSWKRVGGRELQSRNVYHLRFDSSGHVYAATNAGLYRHSASAAGHWQLVLKPDPNPTHSPYRTSHITDVTFKPGTRGRVVLAVLGWRGGTLPSDLAYNGFYVSSDWGRPETFHRITPTGDIDASDIGRTTFSSAGGRIYAVVESPKRLAAPDSHEGFTNLRGVYVSKTGNPAGPWTLVADAATLAHSGSAEPTLFGEFPGVQTGYNQYVEADPHNPSHVYVGLEEVYESTNGGQTWRTIAPYYDAGVPCGKTDPYDCPPTAHSDQHAALISDGSFYTGSDGGVWRRPLRDHFQAGWQDLNATLHTEQYYFAGIGRLDGGDAVWGGLQDNGATLLRPHARRLIQGFTGDGGDVIVDPRNANNVVNEYVFLDPTLSTDAGRHYREISPSCGAFTYTPKPCDPAPQFIAPLATDVRNPNHWVAGGEFIWDDHAAWNTHCSATTCDWKILHDTHASTTALAVNGGTIYAGWCGPCNPATGAPFKSGIDTNAGGSWHTVQAPNLPNRYITSLTVDRNNPMHVLATFGSFSRRWIPAGSVGHVFESRNGGKTWTNITGNLPDNPADNIALVDHRLVVATDVGVFTTRDGSNKWSQLGHGLPNVATWDIAVSPNRRYVVAATHGRGLWKISVR